jgi:hypothetical protein
LQAAGKPHVSSPALLRAARGEGFPDSLQARGEEICGPMAILAP